MKNSTFIPNENKCNAVTACAIKLHLFKGYQLFKYAFLILLLFNFTLAFSSNDKNNRALEAYNLRIDGKTEQAKELLLNILKEDSTNAMAQYELARTLNYMNIRGSAEADQALNAALKFDPKNIVYAYYNAKNCFLKAFMSHDNNNTGDPKNLVDDVCNEFVKVLEMKSDYPEAMMYLVEIYGMLPEEMGGDKIKAEEYTQKLEKSDKFYGAKARLVLMPEGTDKVEYWENHIAKNGEDCRALKELGIELIYKNDIDGAKENFAKAISLDKSQNIRLLDLSRFHQMKVMQNRDAAAVELPKSKEYINQYLESLPEPIPPMKAYAIGILANIEMFSGNNAEAKKLMDQAKALDPYFSRAFGLPSMSTFEPPTQLDHHFTSFFTTY